jgi:hypothetical protein
MGERGRDRQGFAVLGACWSSNPHLSQPFPGGWAYSKPQAVLQRNYTLSNFPDYSKKYWLTLGKGWHKQSKLRAEI